VGGTHIEKNGTATAHPATGAGRLLAGSFFASCGEALAQHVAVPVLEQLVVLLGAFMVAGADPMTDIVTGFGGLVVLINTFLWAWVSAAALAYFWKRRDVSVWETKVAPILSVLIMLTLCAVILIWYTDITGAGGVYARCRG